MTSEKWSIDVEVKAPRMYTDTWYFAVEMRSNALAILQAMEHVRTRPGHENSPILHVIRYYPRKSGPMFKRPHTIETKASLTTIKRGMRAWTSSPRNRAWYVLNDIHVEGA